MLSRDPRILVGIPVYNEETYVEKVLREVRRYADDVLVIDDGSSDRTPQLLAEQQVEVIRHAENRGYGRSMQDMLRWARFDSYDWLITMDCDEQHEPAMIPAFIDAIHANNADVISGSRYLDPTLHEDAPPPDRRSINNTITQEINQRLDLDITDAFCGFKAYRISMCGALPLDVDGYDFPMQFWVRAVAAGARINEIPVQLIYKDPNRTFGGPLDVATTRLAQYRCTLYREIKRCQPMLPQPATEKLSPLRCACDIEVNTAAKTNYAAATPCACER